MPSCFLPVCTCLQACLGPSTESAATIISMHIFIVGFYYDTYLLVYCLALHAWFLTFVVAQCGTKAVGVRPI